MKTFYQRNLILASKSPRRKELLEQAGLNFSIIPSGFDENTVSIKEPAGYAMHLAQNKALDIARQYPARVVIGADTIVVIDDAVLNKPRDKNQAREMLLRLSGKTHQVITGFSIVCAAENREYTSFCQTEVLFKTMSQAEIEWYIDTGEPYDKAGGYAIQGLGSFMIEKVNGSYTNVVGLPVCEVLDYLYKAKIITPVNGLGGGFWQIAGEE